MLLPRNTIVNHLITWRWPRWLCLQVCQKPLLNTILSPILVVRSPAATGLSAVCMSLVISLRRSTTKPSTPLSVSTCIKKSLIWTCRIWQRWHVLPWSSAMANKSWMAVGACVWLLIVKRKKQQKRQYWRGLWPTSIVMVGAVQKQTVNRWKNSVVIAVCRRRKSLRLTRAVLKQSCSPVKTSPSTGLAWAGHVNIFLPTVLAIFRVMPARLLVKMTSCAWYQPLMAVGNWVKYQTYKAVWFP